MKLFLAVTVKTHYVLNGLPYCGKLEDKEVHISLAQNVVEQLTLPLRNSGINVTTDNFFTSIPLAQSLMAQNISLLGTMRSHRREVPKEIVPKRQIGSTMYVFTGKVTLMSYQCKKKKNVILSPM